MQQISQRDSKLVSGWFYLKPSDIATLDFRLLYFFEGAYFRLHKVENYDPNNPITKCYFLKEMYATPFEEINEWANGGDKEIGEESDNGVETIEQLPYTKKPPRTSGNYGKQIHTIKGTNNYVDDKALNVTIQGSNNYIGSYSKDINLVNSNGNKILDGATNVTLINSDNLTISESDVNYQDGKKVDVNNVSEKTTEDKSADFDVEATVAFYNIDTSSSNVEARLYPSVGSIGQTWGFKKTDAANTMVLEAQSGLINGATKYPVTTLNEVAIVFFDGTNYTVIN